MRIHDRSTGFLRFANALVVTVKVFLTGHLQQFVASIHFSNRPRQAVCGLGHVGNHRRQKVRNIFVRTKFHFLRVHQNQLELIRRILVQHRKNHGVDTDGLTGAGGTRDQQMRSLGQIDNDRVSGNPLTQSQGQRRSTGLERMAVDDFF